MPPSSESWSVPAPPENVAVMVPVPPLHSGSALASDSDSAGGSTSVMDWALVHALASLAVTVCDPGATALNVFGEV